MKYYYTDLHYFGSTDPGKPKEITLECLDQYRLQLQEINQHIPVNYMHVINHMYKTGDKRLWPNKSLLYSYEEAIKILADLGVNHFEHAKKMIAEREILGIFESFLKTPCKNCGHMRVWHFENDKCIDPNCDCEKHDWRP